MIRTRQEATKALFERINEHLAQIPSTPHEYENHPQYQTTKKYLSRDELISILKTVLERTDLFKELEENETVKVIRISKEDPKHPNLKRTLHISLQPDNSLALIVENKSKLATGIKSEEEWVEGGQKYGKPSLRIDTKEAVRYYSMVHIIKDAHNDFEKTVVNIQASTNEYQIQSLFKNRIPFNLNIITPIPHSHTLFELEYHEEPVEKQNPDTVEQYKDNIIQTMSKNLDKKTLIFPEKITYHSERALGDLRQILKDEKNLTEFEKEQIKIDILAGIEALHDKKIIHQDIKPENILIYEINGIKRAKITDFGLSIIGEDDIKDQNPTCTQGFESPEIIAYRFVNHYSPLSSVDGLGLQVFNQEFRQSYEEGQNPIPAEYLKPNFSHDIWAAGLVFYYIDNKGFNHKGYSDPRFKTPILNSMLNIPAAQRISAEQAHFNMLLQRDYRNAHCYIQLLDTITNEYIDIIEYESILCAKTSEGQTKKNILDNTLLVLRQVLENMPNHQDEKAISEQLGNLSSMAIQAIERYESLSQRIPNQKTAFSFKSIFSFRKKDKEDHAEDGVKSDYEKQRMLLLSLLKETVLHHKRLNSESTKRSNDPTYFSKR